LKACLDDFHFQDIITQVSKETKGLLIITNDQVKARRDRIIQVRDTQSKRLVEEIKAWLDFDFLCFKGLLLFDFFYALKDGYVMIFGSRYCGHLFSRLARKLTPHDQTDCLSYCMKEKPKGQNEKGEH